MHGSSNLNFASILFLCKCFVNPLKYIIAVSFAWGLPFVTQTCRHCFSLLLFPRFVLFALILSSPCLHLIFRHWKIERPMRHFQLSQINILKRFWCQVLKLVTYNKKRVLSWRLIYLLIKEVVRLMMFRSFEKRLSPWRYHLHDFTRLHSFSFSLLLSG